MSYYHHETPDLEFEFREDLLRPLPALLERLRELIQARNRFKPLNVGLFRIEVWDFDEVVYREAVLNALVHRDYTSRDAVQVHHHPDRLEIANPGAFARGIDPTNILRHAPKRRNPALAEALAKLGYIERAGVGVDKMYQLLLRYGKEPPEYLSYPDAVTLVLRNPEFDEAFTRFVARKQEEMGAVTLDTLIVLSCLKREREATREVLADALQLPPDRVPRVLRAMEDAGLIERHREHGGHYTLSAAALDAIASGHRAHPAPPVAERPAPAAFPPAAPLPAAPDGPLTPRDTVLRLVDAHGSVANRDVRAALDYSIGRAGYLLRAMVREGTLEKTGATPKLTRYVRPA